MSERIAIELGRAPWQPAEDVDVIEVLHHYDMPLVSVVSQGRSLHLVRCISGHVDEAQLWAYTPLADGELDRLREAGQDDLGELLDELGSRRPTVFALAVGDRGVTLSVGVEHASDHESLLHAVRAVIAESLGDLDTRLGRFSRKER